MLRAPPSRALLAVLVIGSAALHALPQPAQAQGPSQTELVSRATDAERAADPARAARLYREAQALAPTSRLASRCRRRLGWLEARSEGDYRPLAAYLAFRDRASVERDHDAVARFERAARAFPAGLVRRESWALIGEAWLSLGEARRAEGAYRGWLEEPALRESERANAHAGLARALALRSGAAAGATHLEEAGLEASSTHVALAREASRARGRVIAWGALALFALAALAIGRRELVRASVLRRALGLPRVLVGLYALGVPWVLAVRYDQEAYDTFGVLAVGGALVLAIASIAGEAAGARAATLRSRALFAGLAVVAYVSVGYLALDRAGQLLSFA